MKRILAAFGVTSLVLLGATATAAASPAESPGSDGEMVTICHATGSESNPYVKISVNINGLNGHIGHQHSEDIIPANDMLPAGQNLDKVDWWNAGCVKPGGAVTPPPTTPPVTPPGGHGNVDHKITICHATGSTSNPYVVITISLNGLNGHANANHQLSEDIIPPNEGTIVPAGQNWTAEGRAIWDAGCVVTVKPPAVTPPGVTPPAVTPPAVTPPGVKPAVPGAVVKPAPRGAVAGPGAVAGGAVANNPGYNVQTAVAESTDAAVAPWVGGLAAMLLAGLVVAVRRTLADGGKP